MLKGRADGIEIEHLGIAHKDDAVRIAHADAGDKPHLPQHLQAMAQHHLTGQIHRDFAGIEHRRAHIHGDGFHPAILHLQLQGADAALGIQGEL